MMRSKAWLCAILSGGILLAGEATPQPAPVQPAPAPVVPAPKAPAAAAPVAPVSPKPAGGPVNPQQITDWTPYLNDFKGADEAKREAAKKVIIDAGMRGVAALDTLSRTPGITPELLKQIQDVKTAVEQRTIQKYQEAAEKAQAITQGVLSPEAVEKARQLWLDVSMYASNHQIRTSSFTQVQNLQKLFQRVVTATQALKQFDTQLAGDPKDQPKGLARASLQLERIEQLKALNRNDEALAAAKDAEAASGKDGRFTAAALKAQAELLAHREDNKETETVCKRILAEHPKSLEVHYAYQGLVEYYTGAGRWDDAIAQAKAFYAACPFDETAQDALNSLQSNLMDEARDYVRAGQFAEWMIGTLAADRLKPEVLKNYANIQEYVVKDYAKAATFYTRLRDVYSDVVEPEDVVKVLNRIGKKAAGQFPKEPTEADEGFAGMLAKFVKAVRTKDKDALKKLVPKDEADDTAELLTDTLDEIVPTVTFGDYFLKKATPDEKGETAEVVIDFYHPGADTPQEHIIEAVKEDGVWKFSWETPEPEDAADAAEVPAGQPAAPQLVPQIKVGPVPPPAKK